MLNSRSMWNSGKNANPQKPEFLTKHYQLAKSYPALKKKGISNSFQSFAGRQQHSRKAVGAIALSNR